MSAWTQAEQSIRKEILGDDTIDKAERAARAALVKQHQLLEKSIESMGKLVDMHTSHEKDMENLGETDLTMLNEDLTSLRMSIQMFSSIKDHLGQNRKNGASLSTVRLEQFAEVVQTTLDHIEVAKDDPTILVHHFLSHQHRDPLNQSLATAVVAIQDMQFGMSDLEQYRREKEVRKWREIMTLSIIAS